jgi:hypothetical protein
LDTGSDLLGLLQEARAAADALLGDATYKVRERVTVNGRTDSGLVEREQRPMGSPGSLPMPRRSASSELCGADERQGSARSRSFWCASAPGFGPDGRRHPAEPGRTGPAGRPRLEPRQSRRFTAGVEDLIANGNTVDRAA